MRLAGDGPWWALRRIALGGTLATLVLGGSAGCPDVEPPAGDDDTEGDDTDGDDDTEGDDDDTTPGAPCSKVFNLELVLLDIWGQDLAEASVVLRADGAEIASQSQLTGPWLIPHDEPAVFEVEVLEAADEFLPTTVTLVVGGGALPDDLQLEQPAQHTGARAAHTFEVREVEGYSCPVATVFVGLDHAWFAATGRPARHDNELALLMDGEESWQAIHADLLTATDRIHHSVWFWHSDFELIRPANHVYSSEAERQQYASMTVLEEQSAARKRLLINRFYEGWDWIDVLYTDTELRDHAETAGDGFEVILQANGTPVPVSGEYQGEAAEICFPDRVRANPAYAGLDLLDPPCAEHDARDLEVPAASWHQKFWLIDDRVAYVGGMNTKSTDWDSNEHLVFDPRRMDFDADTDDRVAVLDREELPDLGPRKDYMIRVAGPCVRDVEDVFATRWEEARATGAAYSENVTAFVPLGYGGALTGDSFAQVVATMPEPWAEMSILESMTKALANAESYIYIEDQYWRAPVLNEVIIETLLQRPWVTLIVVTKPVSSLDGGAKYTYLTDQLFQDLVPDQYLLLQLKSFDVVAEEGWLWDTQELYVQNMDVHSKITIVDDRYLSVGSANKNNRGFLFEGELNVAVLDDQLARAARERIFRNLLGPALASQIGDDADANFQLLRQTAEANEELVDDWEVWIDTLDVETVIDLAASVRPDGFVYPLTVRSEYWFDVGPDLF